MDQGEGAETRQRPKASSTSAAKCPSGNSNASPPWACPRKATSTDSGVRVHVSKEAKSHTGKVCITLTGHSLPGLAVWITPGEEGAQARYSHK